LTKTKVQVKGLELNKWGLVLLQYLTPHTVTTDADRVEAIFTIVLFRTQLINAPAGATGFVQKLPWLAFDYSFDSSEAMSLILPTKIAWDYRL
jgi:hypothetical protein